MHKETITYEDFDGNERTETLYFNISKTRITEDLGLVEEFEQAAEMLQGEERELNTAEKQYILDLVKKVIWLSYGVKSDDGRRFDQSSSVWEDFKTSAAYDEFLFSLFSNEVKAMDFVTHVLPARVVEEAKRQMESTPEPTLAAVAPPSEKSPQEMSREELLQAFKEKTQD